MLPIETLSDKQILVSELKAGNVLWFDETGEYLTVKKVVKKLSNVWIYFTEPFTVIDDKFVAVRMCKDKKVFVKKEV